MTQRVALVTGAGSGIGRAIAARLAADHRAVVVVDRDAPAGQRTAEQIGGQFLHADLAQREACRLVVELTLQRHGRLDILVNNAGFQHVSPIESFPEETWERMLAVMLTAPFLLMRYAWPAMRAQGWGRIVNISSIHGKVASAGKAAYTAAKHGLLGLTRVAALEGGAHGITVNAVCPAYVRTPLVENQIEALARTHAIEPEAVVGRIMLEPAAIKRLIEPEEVADLVAYLCGDSASAVTGADWSIDLGWTAR